MYLLFYHKRTNLGINFEIQVPHPEDKQLTIADWQYDQPFNPFVSHGNQVVRNTLHNQGTVVISVGYSVQQIKVCVWKIRKIVLITLLTWFFLFYPVKKNHVDFA